MVINETEPVNEEEMWFRKKGYYNNPFTIKPAPYDNKIFGYKDIIDKLVYLVNKGSMIFIEGDLGSGKTSILKHLIARYRGSKQVIFFSATGEGKLDIETLLRHKYGFWGRLFNLIPRNMIVLLDEAQHLAPEDTEKVKYFFDHGNIKTVVFTAAGYRKANLHESVRERIGAEGLLKLDKLSYDEAIELIKNRIGDDPILSDSIISKLYYLANFNPRRLLQSCDMVCKYVTDNGYNSVEEDHLKKVFRKVK